MRIRVVIAVALLTGTAAAQSRGPVELADAAVPPGARIAYGKEALQFGELRLPSTKGPHPVAIVIHGGCWLAKLGNFDPRAVALDNMRPVAAALTAAGIATWNIEYRRLGDAGGGWPGTFRDVAAGADHLRALAREHVSLDGPADLKATIALQQPVCGSPVITNLMGGSPEERADRYRDGSPIERLPLGVPQVFYTGQMFNAHAAPYGAAAKQAGDNVEIRPAPKAGHFVFVDPLSDTWPEVLKSVRRLLSMP
jgi:hypothetical protein